MPYFPIQRVALDWVSRRQKGPVMIAESENIVYLIVGMVFLGAIGLLFRVIRSALKPGVDKQLFRTAQTDAHAAAARLIAAGADVHARDYRGETPLHRAVEHGSNRVVALLIENGADVNARDRDGYTALYYAAIHSKPDIAAQLLAHGADDESRVQARSMAEIGEDDIMLAVFQEHAPIPRSRASDTRAKRSGSAAALQQMSSGALPTAPAESKLVVICPNPECGKRLKISAKHAGRRGRCPACKHPIDIPGAPG